MEMVEDNVVTVEDLLDVVCNLSNNAIILSKLNLSLSNLARVLTEIEHRVITIISVLKVKLDLKHV